MSDVSPSNIKFSDRDSLDMFIALTGMDEEEANKLRRQVEEYGYGREIPLDDSVYTS